MVRICDDVKHLLLLKSAPEMGGHIPYDMGKGESRNVRRQAII